MKKISIMLFFFTCYIGVASQNTPLEASKFIPKVTMPSPEAFSFTKYGDVPVGLFTGTMNYSIPLFQIQSGKISVPVSMDYASNGVKVDGISGRTGTDWNLKVGGLITRNILGKPDEIAALYAPSTNDTSNIVFYNSIKYVADNNINTQPDEFSYSFMGASGKFYFDTSGNIKELTPSGYKISTNSALDYFQIVANDGTKYFFSGLEETFTYSFFGDNNALNNSDGGRTAWYLTKIKNIYGDSIEYRYTGLGQVDYLSSISQTYRDIGTHGVNEYIMGEYVPGGNCGSSYSFLYGFGDAASVGMNTDVRFTSIRPVYLTEVLSKQEKIKLYYSSRDDLPGEVKLDSIDLVSRLDSSRVRSIGLAYVYSTASSTYNTPSTYFSGTTLQSNYTYLSKRLFLDKVKFYNSTKTDSTFFKFDYDNISTLPPRLSFAQDTHGYFNGKSNGDFLPSNSIFKNRISFQNASSTRDVDTNYSKKGMLIKITYPTGGFSKIIYQSNYLANYYGKRELFDTAYVGINYNSSSFEEYSDPFNVEIPYSLDVHAEWITPPDPNGPQDDPNVFFSIVNSSDNSCALFCSNENVVPGDDMSYSIQDMLTQSNSYKVKLLTGNTNVRAWAKLIQYHYVDDTVANRPCPGVRVATIKNYTDENVLTGYKDFNYNGPDGKSSGTGIIGWDDKRDFCYIERKETTIGGNETDGANYVLSSSGYFGGFTNESGTLNYQYVTETFDSLETGGKTETKFLIGSTTLPMTLKCVPPVDHSEFTPFLIQGAPNSNTDYLNGKESQKTIYKKSGGSYSKVKEIHNYYSTDSRLYHEDSIYVIRRPRTRSSYVPGEKYYGDFDVNRYRRIIAWTHIDSTVEKTYDDNNHEIKLKTVYQYDNSSHMLPTLVWSLSSKKDTAKKVTKYTDDLKQLDPSNTVLSNMYANNIVNVPLKNQSYSNSTLLTTSLIDYNASLLPYTLKTATGSNTLQTDAEYTSYDATGNPQEFKQRGAPSALLTDTATGTIIAGISNALFADVAYTSFETGYKGNWSGISSSYIQNTGVTGSKYYNQTGFSISKSGLTSGTYYIVSYWSKNGSYTISGTQSGYPKTLQSITIGGNTWTLYEHLVTGQSTITITGSGAIDELRLYPRGALMNTYTYAPLIGISSQSDPSGHISFFEYDQFGRLKLIRDQNQNILKKYEYKYASQ